MHKFDRVLFLQDMYNDSYYPKFLVDKIAAPIEPIVVYLEQGDSNMETLKEKFPAMVEGVNNLQEEFDQNASEIETVARESIGQTTMDILKYFGVNLDHEEALSGRDW